jgi:hypothetical protein
MRIVYQFNHGNVTPVRVSRPSTNEEKYEGLMRSTFVGNKSYISHFIACTTLLKDNENNAYIAS